MSGDSEYEPGDLARADGWVPARLEEWSALGLLTAIFEPLDSDGSGLSEALLALLHHSIPELLQFRVIDRHWGGAAWARDFVLRIKPTNRLAAYLATLPALHGKELFLDLPVHIPNSFVAGLAPTTIERRDAAVTAAASALPSQQIS